MQPVGIEQAAPPQRRKLRTGVALQFASSVLTDGTPGIWYRTDQPVGRNALVASARQWATDNGIVLEMHSVNSASGKEYRLYARIGSTDQTNHETGEITRTHYGEDGNVTCRDTWIPGGTFYHRDVDGRRQDLLGEPPRFYNQTRPTR